LFTKIYLLKLSYCKWHLLKLLSIPMKKRSPSDFNLGSNNVEDLLGKESNYRKHQFMLLPPLKTTFDIFCIHLKLPKNQKFLANKFFLLVHLYLLIIPKLSKIQSSSTPWSTLAFSNKGCKWW
jgi:hypothetical protein